ncbi:MAG: hypothetical protein M3291_09560 [Actinomycetota bacterium]|nr:hypothetical protein [Actinomycetota bacterium]
MGRTCHGHARFDGSAAANVAAGDAFAVRLRAMIDEFIARTGRHAPPVEPDNADAPVQLRPPSGIDLRTVGSVIWCTGFTGDFSWLDPALRDATGQLRRCGVAAVVPGLWSVGLRWFTHRASGNFLGSPPTRPPSPTPSVRWG